MSPRSGDYDTSASDAQIDRWHKEAEEKASQAKFADPKRARQLRKEAEKLMWKAAKLRGHRD